MKKQIDKVAAFHAAFGQPDTETLPTLVKPETYDLRFKLMAEENDEYLQACKDQSKVEIADALGDMLYILCGTILKHGMQHIIEDVFDEIHASNMSKLGPDGKPVINGENGIHDPERPLGKILKGENYFKPNISKFL